MNFKQVIVIALSIFIAGCASQHSIYKKAVEINTVEKYEEFLQKYPEGALTDNIKVKLEKREFENAKSVNTIGSYNSFLEKYPNTNFKNETIELIAILDFENANDINTIEIYQDLINKYPNSSIVKAVQENILSLEYQDAININTLESYKEFLNNYQDSKYESEILNSMAKIEFPDVKKDNTIETYLNFIKKYPESDFTTEAINSSALLEYPKIENSKSIEKYNEFIIKYPNADVTKEVRMNLEKLEYNRAKETNTFSSYEYFIKKYPNSKYYSEANSLREKVKSFSYYVNNSNYYSMNKIFRAKYSEAYLVFIDNFLYKDHSNTNSYSYRNSEPDEVTKNKAHEQLRLILERPVSKNTYDILNMVGCWFKAGSSRASGGSFQSAFSGNFFIRFLFTFVTAKQGKTKDDVIISHLMYCSEDEYTSEDPKIIAFKHASLDMLEDNYNSYTKEPVKEFLIKVKKNETNKELLARIDRILEL